MRFIDLEDLRPLIQPFIPDLVSAAGEIEEATTASERAAVYKRCSGAWTALRDAMSQISHGKCWYTECFSAGADFDVDHFRPKSKVSKVKGHEGYYWLAFAWQNYRLSSQRSNRLRLLPGTKDVGGKGASFPLVDESARAFTPNDNWRTERPLLLDPCNPRDPAILSFGPDGMSRVSPRFKDDPVAVRRWECSHLTLHIDWPEMVRARKKLFNDIDRLVERGARYERDQGAESEEFLEVCRELIRLFRPSAEYSMAARSYIEGFSHEWWITQIVLKTAA